jgi:hypothetical protein
MATGKNLRIKHIQGNIARDPQSCSAANPNKRPLKPFQKNNSS